MSRVHLDGRCLCRLVFLAAMLGPVQWGVVHAAGVELTESLRDPTIAPAAPDRTRPMTSATEDSLNAGLSIIVVDGRPHVIIESRLYAQGQKFGQVLIERISETEIWLREGGRLRKIPMYAGIERHSVSPAAATDCSSRAPKDRGAKAPGSPNPPLGVRSCAKPQP